VKQRTQWALALSAAAAIPLAVLGLGVRREMTSRLDAQAAARVSALTAVLRADLAQESSALQGRLRALANGLSADSRFRLAVQGGERRWLLDWAGQAMAVGGLAVLRVQDSEGRVLSSGHFRNEYDRLDPGLLSAFAAAPGVALIRLAGPDSSVLALAAADSFRVADRPYYLVGGLAFDLSRARALLPASEMDVALALDVSRPAAATAEIPLPFYDAVAGGELRAARLVVTHDPLLRRSIARSVDRWLAGAAALTLLLAGTLALWLSARVSRPLAELAEKTGRLDLDRLDQDFASERDDEIGALSNLLAAMTERLRGSTVRLREAERRAATGDLARQINHDVKNGLAPIRHVLRHLAETAAKQPARLVEVFAERRETLESSVAYLEGLARSYARLAPASNRGSSEVGALLQDVARGTRTEGVEVEVTTSEDLPAVRADPVALRRILENLVSNAVDALEGRPGCVTLASELARNGAEPRVRLSVSDTGRGMSREELDRAFDDFRTTKPEGTGLGLSVVRRLVADLGGTIRVETGPGQGSTFTVELPAA
jgi:signal transduction histidine kinase